MLEARRSSATQWSALALGLATGCAGGESMGSPGQWTVPTPMEEEDEDIDVYPHGSSDASTTGEPPSGSSMSPPPAGSSEGDAPAEDATTTGGPVNGDDSSSTSVDDAMPPPPGEPLWAPCDESNDCESGTCLFLVDGETLEAKSAYCSQPCEDAESDCELPDTGDASPKCVTTEDGDSLCGLDCSDGESCPFGMACSVVSPVVSYCF